MEKNQTQQLKKKETKQENLTQTDTNGGSWCLSTHSLSFQDNLLLQF
uniref:Uncharacterized protein n=1 Tax=Brassica oleracea TaxID=3712 RepID=A0A3P6GN52_BRAOL|nr:unnamed protein product [Brassica oleracea]